MTDESRKGATRTSVLASASAFATRHFFDSPRQSSPRRFQVRQRGRTVHVDRPPLLTSDWWRCQQLLPHSQKSSQASRHLLSLRKIKTRGGGKGCTIPPCHPRKIKLATQPRRAQLALHAELSRQHCPPPPSCPRPREPPQLRPSAALILHAIMPLSLLASTDSACAIAHGEGCCPPAPDLPSSTAR